MSVDVELADDGVVTRAVTACARADALSRQANLAIRRSSALRLAATAHGLPRFFLVRGEIEGLPVRAMWSRGSLLASPPLLSRGRLLVALGESFEGADGTMFAAELEHPLPAMLTLMRACDRIRQIEFAPCRMRPGAPPPRGETGAPARW